VRSGEEAWRKRGTEEWELVPDRPPMPPDGKLEIHQLANIFPPIEGAAFEELVADIKAHGLRERIDLYQGAVVEGRNRYRALKELGVDLGGDYYRNVLHAIGPRERVTATDVRAYVISKNFHRRHLTAEQKRDLVATLIKADPEKSDRQVAKEAHSNRTTVGEIRQDMEERGEVSVPDTRTDSKGVKQPIKRKKKLGAAKKKENREHARAPRSEAKGTIPGNHGPASQRYLRAHE